ncbi:MAG: hypothetical protein QNK11_02690 [Legionella sp.]|nr:hypothetical protein [Legionella sp.]
MKFQLKLLLACLENKKIDSIIDRENGSEMFWEVVLALFSQDDEESIACQQALFKASFALPKIGDNNLTQLHQKLSDMMLGLSSSCDYKLGALYFIAKTKKVSLHEPLNQFVLQLLKALDDSNPEAQKSVLNALSSVTSYIENSFLQELLLAWFFKQINQNAAQRAPRFFSCFGRDRNLDVIDAKGHLALNFLYVVLPGLSDLNIIYIKKWCDRRRNSTMARKVNEMINNHLPVELRHINFSGCFNNPSIGLDAERREEVLSVEGFEIHPLLMDYVVGEMRDEKPANETDYQLRLNLFNFLMISNPVLYEKVKGEFEEEPASTVGGYHLQFFIDIYTCILNANKKENVCSAAEESAAEESEEDLALTDISETGTVMSF